MILEICQISIRLKCLHYIVVCVKLINSPFTGKQCLLTDGTVALFLITSQQRSTGHLNRLDIVAAELGLGYLSEQAVTVTLVYM